MGAFFFVTLVLSWGEPPVAAPLRQGWTVPLPGTQNEGIKKEVPPKDTSHTGRSDKT